MIQVVVTVPEGFLRIDQVAKRCGLGETRIREMVATGEFPVPRQISRRAIAWLESELVEWMHSRPRVAADANEEAPAPDPSEGLNDPSQVVAEAGRVASV
ncbi:MAG: helix-turn-helix transcriptional regulator [Candidatus Eisenbacteria bacterium]